MLDKSLIIIDMLHDFVKGVLRCDRAEEIIPNIIKLSDAFRIKSLPVVYLNDSHIEGIDREITDLEWGVHAIRGTDGAKVISELRPKDRDIVIPKRTYSGFFGTDLDLTLRSIGIKTVVLTGIHTHICVQHTAADAFFRNYKVVVIKDATEAATEDDHKRALEYMRICYGAKIISTSDFIKSM